MSARAWALSLLGAALLGGCTGAGSAPAECVPGASPVCACTNGDGVRTCGADGRFGPCVCPPGGSPVGTDAGSGAMDAAVGSDGAGAGEAGSGEAGPPADDAAPDGAEAGASCRVSTGCARAASSAVEYTYECTGFCNGSGTVALYAGADYRCAAGATTTRSGTPYEALTVSGLAPRGDDLPPSTSLGFNGYAFGSGGAPSALSEGQTCHTRRPEDPFPGVDNTQPETPHSALGIFLPLGLVPCMDGMQHRLAVTNDDPQVPVGYGPLGRAVDPVVRGWVCADCVYQEGGRAYTAAGVGFAFEGGAVLREAGWRTTTYLGPDAGPTYCTVRGGALLGGCTLRRCAP